MKGIGLDVVDLCRSMARGYFMVLPTTRKYSLPMMLKSRNISMSCDRSELGRVCFTQMENDYKEKLIKYNLVIAYSDITL